MDYHFLIMVGLLVLAGIIGWFTLRLLKEFTNPSPFQVLTNRVFDDPQWSRRLIKKPDLPVMDFSMALFGGDSKESLFCSSVDEIKTQTLGVVTLSTFVSNVVKAPEYHFVVVTNYPNVKSANQVVIYYLNLKLTSYGYQANYHHEQEFGIRQYARVQMRRFLESV